MPSTKQTPRVAVIGGGIGGLAAAAYLSREGIEVTVYEQARELSEVGAGLVVAPNVIRLLRQLSGFPHFLERAVPLDIGWEFRRWRDGEVLSAEDLSEACERLYGERTYSVHRADLLEAIRLSVPAAVVRLGARCVRVEPIEDIVRVHLDDGTTHEVDVVIGADGVHSVVRGVVADPSPAADSGICAFRALVPIERTPVFARRSAQTLWVGPGRHLVHYPIAGGRLVNLVAFAPAGASTEESWTATATPEELLAEFDGWDPRLTDLIRAAGPPGRWALLERAPLERWTAGRVTLLGDAAHPMFPFFAQGAGQAIEDAVTLAGCLAADRDDPPAALRRYERLRIERATQIQTASRHRALVNHLPDGPEQIARDAALKQSDPLVQSGWIYGHDVMSALHGGGA